MILMPIMWIAVCSVIGIFYIRVVSSLADSVALHYGYSMEYNRPIRQAYLPKPLLVYEKTHI